MIGGGFIIVFSFSIEIYANRTALLFIIVIPPKTVVTWELEKMENNKTRIKLLHTGFKPDETSKKHDQGWAHFLAELTKYSVKIE